MMDGKESNRTSGLRPFDEKIKGISCHISGSSKRYNVKIIRAHRIISHARGNKRFPRDNDGLFSLL